MDNKDDRTQPQATQGPRVFTVPIVDKSEKNNNRNMPTVVFIVKY